jgi:Flp pilus assembly protein TadG
VCRRNRPRRGAHIVETALVFPVLVFLVLGLILGGFGVFRYQQVACLAQEAARYASVRAGDFQAQTNQTSPTQAQILEQVQPLGVGMDTTQLSLQAQWVNQATGEVQSWDTVRKDVKSSTSSGEYVTNTVRVTVTYQWSPGLFVGTITLMSICEIPLSF